MVTGGGGGGGGLAKNEKKKEKDFKRGKRGRNRGQEKRPWITE